jgi:hypothetical protein
MTPGMGPWGRIFILDKAGFSGLFGFYSLSGLFGLFGLFGPGEIGSPWSSFHTPQGRHISRDKFVWSTRSTELRA